MLFRRVVFGLASEAWRLENPLDSRYRVPYTQHAEPLCLFVGRELRAKRLKSDVCNGFFFTGCASSQPTGRIVPTGMLEVPHTPTFEHITRPTDRRSVQEYYIQQILKALPSLQSGFEAPCATIESAIRTFRAQDYVCKWEYLNAHDRARKLKVSLHAEVTFTDFILTMTVRVGTETVQHNSEIYRSPNIWDIYSYDVHKVGLYENTLTLFKKHYEPTPLISFDIFAPPDPLIVPSGFKWGSDKPIPQ